MSLAIKGHPTRGKEVIKRLKMLGGINYFNLDGAETNRYYYIDSSNSKIYSCLSLNPQNCIGYTLEEFEEKFPYKVGDKVKNAKIKDFIGRIINAQWKNNENQIIYTVEWNDATQSKLNYFARGLQPYKEENYCQVIGNDISSNGVNTSASLINGEIIEENINEKTFPPYMDYDITETKEQEDIEEKDEKSANHVFDTEIISFDIAQRDKYELDLQGKFKVVLREGKYYVERIYNISCVLEFPTADMRDAFYEDFKDLIEECKELL